MFEGIILFYFYGLFDEPKFNYTIHCLRFFFLCSAIMHLK